MKSKLLVARVAIQLLILAALPGTVIANQMSVSPNSSDALSSASTYKVFIPLVLSNSAAGAPSKPTPTATVGAVKPTVTPTGASTPSPTATPSSTVAPPAADPVIAAAGDIACDPANAAYKGGTGTSYACRQLYVSNVILQLKPIAVLALGDTQYEVGALSAFQQSYNASWGRFKGITFPAVGNHEYLTAGASGYYSYFGAAAGDPHKGYYSYDVGTWHLIALNTQCSNVGGCGPGSPQETWLRADLAAHPSQCTLAYYHIPLWSSGGRANSGSQTFMQDLYNAHADLVLTGHDHIYERFAPQNPAGNLDPMNGIREFVVGTGGADHTSITSIAKNSEIRDAATFGALKVTLHASSYDWQFVPEPGGTFTDSGNQACH